MTLVESHGLANRPGEPYPATFRMFPMSVDRPGVEPGFPPRQGGVFPLDHQPIRFSVDRMGVEPIAPSLQGSVAPNGMPARSSEVRPGIEPGLRPYHGRVLPKHLQTILFSASDPGWNRTSTFLHVTQASSPLDHGIK